MRRLLILVVLLSACAEIAPPDADMAPPEGMTRPMPRPDSDAPPSGARTADAFDTTTDAERAAALSATVPGTEARLGRTVATLGSPADPGLWLETPLTDRVRPGRVVAVASGESVKLELRPIDAPPGAGSRISLPAVRLLNIGLTGLHDLDVFGQ
ncbi:hypothetical protein [Maritimibacter sp. HL-12]|jgi:hypothetical protein|uniref:hypothetical protein n=1 Tax=Maritimibacter sp. HL-12 TaxID=1162418 RepID=UPI000A0F0B99|nr:hypothetical protein [Maritimibacter sp. HL-12]SMH53021.1 hypothetical protein SAMN05661107_2701 [Maritimibacter sp. HL-12]